MKSNITRVLMATFVIFWAISANVYSQDDVTDEEHLVQISPFCLVVGIDHVYVTVKTDIPYTTEFINSDYALGLTCEEGKNLFYADYEVNRQGNIVFKFPYRDLCNIITSNTDLDCVSLTLFEVNGACDPLGSDQVMIKR